MTTTRPCSLPPEELTARAREWHSLDDALLDAQPSSAGAVLTYRLEPGVAETLFGLIQAERTCCPSLSIEATVTVHVEAPEDVRAWVAETFVSSESTPSSPRP